MARETLYSVVIGGPQGSGVNLSSELFAKALSRGGWQVFGNIEYHSNIKGKHSHFRLTISELPIHSHVENIDLLIALDEESLFGDLYHHFPQHRGLVHAVVDGGGIVYDAEIKGVESRLNNKNIRLLALPYLEILEETFVAAGRPKGDARKYRIMNNTLALGAAAGTMGYDFQLLEEVIRESFESHKKSLADLNVLAAKHAYDHAKKEFGGSFTKTLHSMPQDQRKKRIMIKGAQAVAIAKLKAGCGVQTYYPISPATDESVYLEEHEREYPIVIVQTEDEVSAIDMAVAATLGGARASTSTSGPGFALMPEGLGLASMMESGGPVVCIYQRGGPSTGLPTRNEQGDLRFALHAGQGDFPKIVMAGGDMADCMELTFASFNYADRYQVPIILLFDRHQAGQYITMPMPDFSKWKVDRGVWFEPKQKNGPYHRYKFTDNGISPRAYPGQEGGIFWTTSDDHDETGHISEGIGNRLAIMEKRMKKLNLALKEIPQKHQFECFGPDNAEIVLIGWGSSKGVLLDLLPFFNEKKPKCKLLQIKLFQPFPADLIKNILDKAKTSISFDQNYSAQMAQVIREHTGIDINYKVVKYDGRPFSQDEIVSAVNAVEKGCSSRIIVADGDIRDLSYGLKETKDLVLLRDSSPKMQPPMVPLPPGYNQ